MAMWNWPAKGCRLEILMNCWRSCAWTWTLNLTRTLTLTNYFDIPSRGWWLKTFRGPYICSGSSSSLVVEFAQSFDRLDVLLGFRPVDGHVHLLWTLLMNERLFLWRAHSPHHHRTLHPQPTTPRRHVVGLLGENKELGSKIAEMRNSAVKALKWWIAIYQSRSSLFV